MSDNMYDERGFLKPEYADLAESQEKEIFINTGIEKIDPRTDFGKGIVFKSFDGGEHDSMEAVERANKAYFDSRIIDDTSNKDYSHYAELEKADFDCIKDMTQQNNNGNQKMKLKKIIKKHTDYNKI